MQNAFTFIQQSKKDPSNEDPFEGIAIGSMLLLFLIVVSVIGGFVLVGRGIEHKKAMEEKSNTLQEKIRGIKRGLT